MASKMQNSSKQVASHKLLKLASKQKNHQKSNQKKDLKSQKNSKARQYMASGYLDHLKLDRT